MWTNLIDNAIDAMDGSGTLRISTSATDRDVVVEIADSGPGVPDDVLPHVFEPFFTTKDVGRARGWVSTSPVGSSSTDMAATSP